MVDSGLYTFDRSLTYHVANIFAVRMAGVFMVSTATIWSRSRTMPRWLVVPTYALALMQPVTVSYSHWVSLIFPAWTFSVSVFILFRNFRKPRNTDLRKASQGHRVCAMTPSPDTSSTAHHRHSQPS